MKIVDTIIPKMKIERNNDPGIDDDNLKRKRLKIPINYFFLLVFARGQGVPCSALGTVPGSMSLKRFEIT